MPLYTISQILYADMDRDETDTAIYQHVLHIDGPGAIMTVDGSKRACGWPLVTVYPSQDAYEGKCEAVYSEHLPDHIITYLRRMAWVDEAV
jgi:hypothetical protein